MAAQLKREYIGTFAAVMLYVMNFKNVGTPADFIGKGKAMSCEILPNLNILWTVDGSKSFPSLDSKTFIVHKSTETND